MSLGPADTSALLDGATRQLGATVQELLVAALLLGWTRWTGRSGLQLDVEGHGRDAFVDGLDVSRTVGWFTTVFPLSLELRERSAEAAVRSARAALRGLPMRGGAHGLLRYLHPDASLRRALAELPRSELLFNYLGSVDDLLPPDSPFEWAPEPGGRERSPAAPRAYRIEVNARVEKRSLTLDIEYSSAVHRAVSIARLGNAITTALSAISVQASAPTSRFEFANLDDTGLKRVTDLSQNKRVEQRVRRVVGRAGTAA